ncbi:MAG: threonylcarbamoyl-AMP synthase [Candidatus Dadabacteria bacterium]|nr:MAG: threonylcarbamoyl-AMP synthase [Candidatus Dadabacteria bacterium]
MTASRRINDLADVVRLLNDGSVVAIPTESFFALAARIDRPEALMQLAELKRGRQQPIGLIAADTAAVEPLVADISRTARQLIDDYWPGPLTVVFQATLTLSDILTAGTDTIGIRVPADPLLQQLLRSTGPLTATSANRPGEPPAVTVEAVEAAFPDLPVWSIVKQAPGGLPSTVVDARGVTPRVIRAGAVPLDL